LLHRELVAAPRDPMARADVVKFVGARMSSSVSTAPV